MVVPFVPSVAPVTVNVSPSGSVSFPKTVVVTAVSTCVVTISSTASGGALIVTVTVAVSVPPFPSLRS